MQNYRYVNTQSKVYTLRIVDFYVKIAARNRALLTMMLFVLHSLKVYDSQMLQPYIIISDFFILYILYDINEKWYSFMEMGQPLKLY